MSFVALTAAELLEIEEPDSGTLYFETDTRFLQHWNGSTFVQINGGGTTREIIFTTTGSSFSPVLTVTGTPTILWTWNDDTTSNSATPTKSYGTAATRNNRLTVTPWSAVTRINIGYDEGDGGDPAIEHVADQHVSAVSGLSVVAPTLQQWCSSYNAIDTLNFADFVNLDTIECYHSASLNHVTLTNVPKLARVCFEQCSLDELDVSDVPMLADLRATGNGLTTITYGTTGAHQWHVCTMNSFTDQHVYNDMTQWPLLRDFWIAGCNQAGALTVPSSREYLSMWGSGNHYTSADFTGSMTNPSTNSSVDLSGNELTSVTITGCYSLTTLDISDNHLNDSAVASVLATLDNLGRSGGTVDVSGNATLNSSAVASRLSLIGKSWTVTADLPQVATPTFDPVAGTYESTQSVTLSCATNGATIHYTTNGDTPTAQSATYSTAISVSVSETVRAIALLSGYTDSAVGSATYTIGQQQTATPTFNPAAGSYSSTQSVEISCSTSNSTIYYTTNGDTPTTGSTVYTGAISVSTSQTVRAIATASDHSISEVGSAAYTIGATNRIDFTTIGQVMDVLLVAPDATVTWHWSDSTTSTGENPLNKDFGSAAERSHYVIVEPNTALTAYGNNGSNEARITAISGLGNFPHLHILYLYMHSDLATVDIAGCAEMNRMHLRYSGLTTDSYDALLIALAAQGIPYNNAWGDGEFYTPSCSPSSASAAARSTLAGLGWPSL